MSRMFPRHLLGFLPLAAAVVMFGIGTSSAATAGCGCTAVGTATYRMTFTAVWTDPTPPSSFPHWSWPIGTSHSPCYTMWRNGALASPGVKSMAETGSTTTLKGEFSAQGANTLSTYQGGFIGSASGTSSVTFTTDRYHSLTSVTSMIAPSPDWFVGVDSLDLCAGSSWKSTITLQAYPWDSGTDSGLTFTAGNQATSPAQFIARITAASSRTTSYQKSSGSTASMGRFKFDLLSTDTTSSGTSPNCVKCPTTAPPTAAPTTPPPVETTPQPIQTTPPPSTQSPPTPAGCGCTAVGTATYRMTFTAVWTDPTPPSRALWTWQLGTSHSPCYTMWRNGALASPAFETIAEMANGVALIRELNGQGANTLGTYHGDLIPSASGSSSTTFTTDRYHSLTSVMSSFLPGPDWFVGVDSLNLCAGSTWNSTITLQAYPWDAGTDSGLSFTAVDQDTSPAQPIARITATSDRTTSFLKSNGTTASMGTFTFDLLTIDTNTSGTNPNCTQCPTTAPPTTAGTGTQAGAAAASSSGLSGATIAVIAVCVSLATILAVATITLVLYRRRSTMSGGKLSSDMTFRKLSNSAGESM